MLKVIVIAMGAVAGIGVLASLISSATIGRIVKAASEIQRSNHRLMKLVKAKFEHASMVSDKVQNVNVFVEKYFYEYKVFGVRLGQWKSLPRKAVWITGVLGLFGVAISYETYGMRQETTQFLAWTGLFLVPLIVMCLMSDYETKISAAKTYVVDYLENVCMHRYEKANQTVEPQETVVEEPVIEVKEKETEQEVRIRAILEEFLA